MNVNRRLSRHALWQAVFNAAQEYHSIRFPWAAAFLLATGLAQPAFAQYARLGETYEINGINFPTDFTETVVLDGTTKTINGGQLTVTETITSTGPDSEWIEFTFSRVGGGPLAGNLASPWEAEVDMVPTAPAFHDQFFLYWSENGTAFNPINAGSGFTPVNLNPIDPNRGPVYYGTPHEPRGPNTSYRWFANSTPYSFINGLGINTAAANGFHMAFHLVSDPDGLLGDFDKSGVLDLPDVNMLTTETAAATNDDNFDLNADTLVNSLDIIVWVKQLFGSWIGDLNLDKEFNSTDLTLMLVTGTYESGAASVWSQGDFNGDGVTDSSDLTFSLADGGYELGPPPPIAVPEPSSAVLLCIGLLAIARRSDRLETMA